MNRTDRLLAIVLQLQARGRQRVQDLAAAFEVSRRTILRDVQALCEAGVPVVATRQGYELPAGYFLPPLQFTAHEAGALCLGAELVGKLLPEPYRGASVEAQRKIEAVLPADVRADLAHQRETTWIVRPRTSEDKRLTLIRQALDERRVVRLAYQGRDETESTLRDVEPHALVHYAEAWYVTGYCRVRRDVRNFRLERIRKLQLRAEHYTPPPPERLAEAGVRSANWSLSAPPSLAAFPVAAEILVDAVGAQRAREHPPFGLIATQSLADGGARLSFRLRAERDLLAWLLSLGIHGLVLQPESLAQRVQDEARALLQRYRTGVRESSNLR